MRQILRGSGRRPRDKDELEVATMRSMIWDMVLILQGGDSRSMRQRLRKAKA